MAGSLLEPTFEGYIHTTDDALILIRACIAGRLNLIPRRPEPMESKSLIKSGAVFIYIETKSGIKRWNDNISWSPSRTLHGFLIYGQQDDCSGPGPNRRQVKKKSPQVGVKKQRFQRGEKVAWAGSLPESFDLKDGGLFKKTFKCQVEQDRYCLVSYFNIRDVNDGRLKIPSTLPDFENYQPLNSEFSCAQGGNFTIPQTYEKAQANLPPGVIQTWSPFPVSSSVSTPDSHYDATTGACFPIGMQNDKEMVSIEFEEFLTYGNGL